MSTLGEQYTGELRSFMASQTRMSRIVAYDPIYTDMAGDVLAGLVLSQICFWHRASKETGKTKLRVAKDGRLWAAISVKEMQGYTHMTPSQITRCYNLLAKKNLILKKVWRFAGTPTTHISLNWPVFKAEMARCEQELVQDVPVEDIAIDDAELPAVEPKIILSSSADGFAPERKSDLSPSSNHYIDSTKTTTKRRRPVDASPSVRDQQNAVRKAVSEHFQQLTNLKPTGNAKSLGRLWWSPIREICELTEWNEQRACAIVSDVVKSLAGLTISDPNSILKTARATVAQQGNSHKPTLQKVKVIENGKVVEMEMMV